MIFAVDEERARHEADLDEAERLIEPPRRFVAGNDHRIEVADMVAGMRDHRLDQPPRQAAATMAGLDIDAPQDAAMGLLRVGREAEAGRTDQPSANEGPEDRPRSRPGDARQLRILRQGQFLVEAGKESLRRQAQCLEPHAAKGRQVGSGKDANRSFRVVGHGISRAP